MAILKNIAQEQVLPLAQQVEAEAGQIVSKTLAQNDAVSITLFAFSKGEEISTHASGGDAMVLVLEGRGRFTIDGREHFCSAGESIVMPAGKPHAAASTQKLGINLIRVAILVIFVWIGGLKFWNYEAEGIVPFVANSPFLFLPFY